MKRLRLAISVSIALLVLLVNAAGIAAESNKDGNAPVFARDVELAKKVQVERGKGPAKPPKTIAYASTGTVSDTVSGKKYAIIIGISDYPGSANDLRLCDDDARDVVAALAPYQFDSIKTFIDEEGKGSNNATRTKIYEAITTLPTMGAEDEVLFFFSGHGGRGKADDGDKEVTDECIWVHDGTKLVPIWDGELAAWFSTCGSRHLTFIFDSCYAGGMTDLAGPGRVVAMASTENSLSYEISGIGNGEFTYYMIDRGIYSELADKYDTGYDPDITVEEAWDYAKLNCRYDSVTISDRFTDDLLP